MAMDLNRVVRYVHDEKVHNTNAATQVLPFLREKLGSISSVLDVGCGTGTWLRAAQSLGIDDIQGLDGVAVEQKKLHVSPEKILIHNLTLPVTLNRKFDLAICLEVAEHLPTTAAKNIIEILTTHSDIILFSAAIPHQGGQNHINEQWPEFWQKLFEKKNFYPYDLLRGTFWKNDQVEWWYKQNMIVYATKENPKLSFTKSEMTLNTYIHPELFIAKVEENEKLTSVIENYIHKPRIIPSLKALLKALFR